MVFQFRSYYSMLVWPVFDLIVQRSRSPQSKKQYIYFFKFNRDESSAFEKIRSSFHVYSLTSGWAKRGDAHSNETYMHLDLIQFQRNEFRCAIKDDSS